VKATRIIVAIAAICVAGYFVLSNLQARRIAPLNNEAMALLEQKKFAEARDLLERARRIAPNNPIINKNLGAAYEGLDDTTKAIEAYERSLSANPNQPDLREAVAELKAILQGKSQE